MDPSYETQTLLFSGKGPANTDNLLRHAARRAKELGLKKVVIATCSGQTAKKALEFFPPNEFEIIAVTHVTGFSEPNVQELPEEVRRELETAGVKVLTAAHAFGGLGRGIRNKLKTYQVDEIMAYTLRMFGQGVKVGVEIAYAACDRGWVRTDEDILTIAGSGRGADAVLVVRPANSHNCLDAAVREIVAKPWNP